VVPKSPSGISELGILGLRGVEQRERAMSAWFPTVARILTGGAGRRRAPASPLPRHVFRYRSWRSGLAQGNSRPPARWVRQEARCGEQGKGVGPQAHRRPAKRIPCLPMGVAPLSWGYPLLFVLFVALGRAFPLSLVAGGTFIVVILVILAPTVCCLAPGLLHACMDPSITQHSTTSHHLTNHIVVFRPTVPSPSVSLSVPVRQTRPVVQ
jgi:hypothetical protein